MTRRLWGVSIALLWTLGSATSFAQPVTKDADAERLFREGQNLMAEHRYGEACPKFEAAYRKDQQLGTLLNLAYCHKEQGAIWQAWLEFREAEVKAAGLKRTDRKDFAHKSLVELEKSLARIVIDTNSKVELSEVVVEDRTIPEAEKGQSFAAEPGQRKFVFRAKGKKDAVQLVTVVKGDRPQHVAVPEMVDDTGKEPVVIADPPPVRDPPPTTAPTDDGRDGSLQRTLGLVFMGVGVVGLGVGSVFGLMTLSNECADSNNATVCTQEIRDTASSNGTLSTLLMIPSGAFIVGGGFLWLTAPRGKSTSTVGGSRSAQGHAGAVRVTPQLGAGWAGVSGSF